MGSDFRFPTKRTTGSEANAASVTWIFPGSGLAGEWAGSDYNSQGRLLARQGMLDGEQRTSSQIRNYRPRRSSTQNSAWQ
jgi:hypothetical protein